MVLKPAAKKSKTCKACFGVSAVILIFVLLAACGGSSDSDSANDIESPDQTTTTTSSEQSDAADEQSQAAGSSEDGEASDSSEDSDLTLPTGPTLPAEPALPPEDESTGGLPNFGENLNNVLEAVLEENGADSPAPADISVIVQDGEIVQGETRYEVALGQNIVIEVFSSQFNHEVHVHGYDLTDFAGPISPARFEFEANLAGTWEVEFEETSELIFELVVR